MPDISPAGREVLIQDMNRETFSLLVERRFRDVTGSFFTASTSFLDHPIKLEAAEVEAAQRRGRLILEFMDECLAIARECVIEDGDPVLRQLLFSDVLPHTSIEWHRQLPDSAWTRPIWFRTDESPEGVIYEVQCPGSGWGDLLLLKDCLLQHGTGTLSSDDIRAKFVSDVKDVTSGILGMTLGSWPAKLTWSDLIRSTVLWPRTDFDSDWVGATNKERLSTVRRM